jgi:hypothetical protein
MTLAHKSGHLANRKRVHPRVQMDEQLIDHLAGLHGRPSGNCDLFTRLDFILERIENGNSEPINLVIQNIM